MATIFSRIAAGEIPSYKVAEDKDHFAFLDINPVHPGHVLVIPRKETDYIFDLSDEEYASLMLFAKRVAKAIKKAIPCKKVGVTVIGLDVDHVRCPPRADEHRRGHELLCREAHPSRRGDGEHRRQDCRRV